MDARKLNSFDFHEEIVQNYYDMYWSMRAIQHPVNEFQGFHHGFFEKGVNTPRKATQNTNALVEQLLNLHTNDTKDILDVGCGIGCTSIYLAKKYPQSHFRGITLSPVEIQLANKIIDTQKLTNIKCILGNYHNLDFYKGNFDCVFALESINHSPDKKMLVRELSKVIKPGGKLIVVDWFRTDIPFASIMQKIYTAWCVGQANISLETHNTFLSYLHEEGFKDVQINNLYPHIRRSLFFTFFVWSPVFFIKLWKKILKRGKEKSSDDMKYLLALSALDVLIGIGNIARYCSITAIKK